MLDDFVMRLEVMSPQKRKIVMEIIKLSPTENDMAILKEIRTLKPFENLSVTADSCGKPDYYLLHRQSKMILTQTEPKFIK